MCPSEEPLLIENAATIMRVMELTDSMLPVGAFSFSLGLEAAAEEGLVSDAESLDAYVRDVVRQAAFTDGIVALYALRSYHRGNYAEILGADEQAICSKLNAENRLMSCRMGKKLAELSEHLFSDRIIAKWLGDIRSGHTPGTYPVAQGVVFAACGIPERMLFCSQQFGTANMVLSAALRCVRVSHYDTQRILYRLSEDVQTLYDEVRCLDFDDMFAFVPQIDILASLHEKGVKRLFMN